ncbi:Rop-like family nitrogen fixation protein (plasmid) [Rhizobium etli bv. mimosae str. IE4771]|uniref:Rop-like family nitrogen fixation protein n=1 Tax=Rhizobium etli bv. mimosae str. IE4771 TaxID=1432050 RepID=A0A060I7V4_RHIET|nr:Rop-like family nitrogen fixation protein [Rhizobium sp. IE4771]
MWRWRDGALFQRNYIIVEELRKKVRKLQSRAANAKMELHHLEKAGCLIIEFPMPPSVGPRKVLQIR